MSCLELVSLAVAILGLAGLRCLSDTPDPEPLTDPAGHVTVLGAHPYDWAEDGAL